MPLVAAKCTQCGANLEIDSTKEAAVCPSCDTPFITEKAIHYQNTYNQNHYQIENAQVHIHDERSVEVRLKNAEVFYTKHKDAAKAREIFSDVANDAPDDYRGWWGLVRIDSRDFTFTDCGAALFSSIKNYAARACNVAPPEIREELQRTFDQYAQGADQFASQKQGERADLVSRKTSAEARQADLRSQWSTIREQIEILTRNRNDIDDRLDSPGMKWYVISGVLIFASGIGLIVFIPLIIRLIILKTSLRKRNEQLAEQTEIHNHLQEELARVDAEIRGIKDQIQVVDKNIS